MGITPDLFTQLWEAMREPYNRLDHRIALLERKMSRAEVAGAVEVVSSLPAPGQAGRLLYATPGPGNLFVDRGGAFVPAAPNLGFVSYRDEGAANWQNTTLDWTTVWPDNLYLEITPSSSRVFIQACACYFMSVVSAASASGFHTLFLDETNLGDDTRGLGFVEISPAVAAGAVAIWNLPSAALVTGLTPGQTYRITARAKTSNATYAVQSARFRTNYIVAWEV